MHITSPLPLLLVVLVHCSRLHRHRTVYYCYRLIGWRCGAWISWSCAGSCGAHVVRLEYQFWSKQQIIFLYSRLPLPPTLPSFPDDFCRSLRLWLCLGLGLWWRDGRGVPRRARARSTSACSTAGRWDEDAPGIDSTNWNLRIWKNHPQYKNITAPGLFFYAIALNKWVLTSIEEETLERCRRMCSTVNLPVISS